MHRLKCVIFCVILSILVENAYGCGNDTKETRQFTNIDFSTEQEEEESASSDEEEPEEKQTVIYVDVCGQVNTPGVYELSNDSRVYEAIEKAGGVTEKAALSSLNQAEKLSDGQQIYVPSKEEVEKGVQDKASTPGEEQNGKINLNTATKEELMTLSGIGETKAEAIIRYRNEQGDFQSIEDIKKIEGIKDGIFNKVKDQIAV